MSARRARLVRASRTRPRRMAVRWVITTGREFSESEKAELIEQWRAASGRRGAMVVLP